jgi:hypothetical protein
MRAFPSQEEACRNLHPASLPHLSPIDLSQPTLHFKLLFGFRHGTAISLIFFSSAKFWMSSGRQDSLFLLLSQAE